MRAALYIVIIVLALNVGLPLVAFLAFLVFVRPLEKVEKEGAREPYSGGSASVSPETVVAGSGPAPIEVTYRVGPGGIKSGGGVSLRVGKVVRFGPEGWEFRQQWASGWGSLQRRGPHKPNYLEVTASRDEARLDVHLTERASTLMMMAWAKRKLLQKLGFKLEGFDPKDTFAEGTAVTVRVSGRDLEEGDTIVFGPGSGPGMKVPKRPLETDFAIAVDPLGTGDYRLEASVPTVKVTGGAPSRLEVIAPSSAAPGERITVLVRCLDDNGFLAPGFEGRIRLSASGRLELPESLEVVEGGEGVHRFEAAVTGGGIARVYAGSEHGLLEGESNPVICDGSPGRLLWGDIHTHSVMADGTMEPGYFYHRARDLLGWDLTAVADHDLWTIAEESPRTPEELGLMVREADENYRPGEFVTFRAYEWSEHHQGHRNVLFGPGEEMSFFPHSDPRYRTAEALFQALEGRDVIVIPHHPAWKTHFGEMRFNYGPADNPLQRLVEVYSQHGNSEFYGCPKPISHFSLIEGMRGRVMRLCMPTEYAGRTSGSYVRDALAAGHRICFVAGSDEHLSGTDPRNGPSGVYPGGLTGVFSRGKTREAVWEALRSRRVCATSGPRIFIELNCDGRPQGSELKADSPPRITGRVVGTAALELVEVVKFVGGGYSSIWQAEGRGREVVIDITDRDFRSSSLYYLRLIQSDGHLGWAGPIWADRA